MSLYMIASLLEHELLISLANQIMHSPHHKAPTDDDLKNAHEFADLALQLALEGLSILFYSFHHHFNRHKKYDMHAHPKNQQLTFFLCLRNIYDNTTQRCSCIESCW